ncbi:MAG: T9SS type A sorting domain-containing protein [Flavobacteriales bacterium]|nr:T9SS type A sorting domain-containing protein [Flavobacteriales bacterium]
MGKNKQGYGLPNFNNSYFHTPPLDFSYVEDCDEHQYRFTATDTFRATNHKWLFKKGSTIQTESGREINHTFTDTGRWEVSYIASNASLNDTVTKTLIIYPKWQHDFLGRDTSYCSGDNFRLVLKSQPDMHCIHWMGETGQDYGKFHVDSMVVDTAGAYFVKVTNKSFCTMWDTIVVHELLSPPKPMLMRKGDSLISSFNASVHRWYRNGLLLWDETSSSVKPDSNGLYWMEAENAQGCVTISDSILVDDLGLVKAFEQGGMKIYPNPVKEQLTIESPYSGYIHSIRCYDVSGKLLFEQEPSDATEKISVAGWPKGLYVLKLLTENGEIWPVTIHKQ